MALRWTYVIELAPAAVKRASDQARLRRGAPVLYVGQTGQDPAARLLAHLRGGYQTSTVVREHGLRVLSVGGPHDGVEAAEAAERRLAGHLRRAGAVVFGGH